MGLIMRNIDRIFILTGALFAVFGLCLGLWMVAVNNFAYSKIHAHVNLLGWVTLAIYGIVYKLYPVMKDSSLALSHLVCSVAGVIFMNLGWWMFLQNILVGTKTLVIIFPWRVSSGHCRCRAVPGYFLVERQR